MLIDLKSIDLEKTFGQKNIAIQRTVLRNELRELEEASLEFSRAHKLEEICDVIQATLSYADSMGFNMKEIKLYFETIHQKKLMERNTFFKEEY